MVSTRTIRVRHDVLYQLTELIYGHRTDSLVHSFVTVIR